VFTDHVGGVLGVSSGDIREDGSIGNSEAIDSRDSKAVVDHSLRISCWVTHFVGTNEVIARTNICSDEGGSVTEDIGLEGILVGHIIGGIEGISKDGSLR